METDWESLAWECFQHMEMAVTKLQNTRDWTGNMFNKSTGKITPWEEGFAVTMEKFPGVKLDRRWYEAKWLPAKERRKAYEELNAEIKNTAA